MQYKILALDLDGTLTNTDKIITPRTKAALQAAAQKGVCIVLASGRPTVGIEPLAKELELEKSMVYRRRAGALERFTSALSGI